MSAYRCAVTLLATEPDGGRRTVNLPAFVLEDCTLSDATARCVTLGNPLRLPNVGVFSVCTPA